MFWKIQNTFLIGVASAMIFAMPLQANVLFVGGQDGPTQGDDGAVFTHLTEDLGLDVRYLSGNASTTADGENVDLLIISSTLGSGSVRGKFQGISTPILHWEEALTRINGAATNFQMSQRSAAGTVSPPVITIVDSIHPLAAGLSEGDHEISSQVHDMAWGTDVAPGAIVIAEITQSPDQKAIFVIPEGEELADGTIAPGARLNFPLRDTGFAVLNDTGLALFDAAVSWLLNPEGPEPFTIDGNGQSYFQNFDENGTNKGLPRGWTGEDTNGTSRRADSLGLVDGPLEGAAVSAAGIVNVGGNADRFSAPADGRLGTWKDDLDNSGAFDEGDVIADAAADRAIGNGRVLDDDVGKIHFEVEIANRPVRALVTEWDLEVWGGDPEAAFRGAEGGGYTVDLSVGGTSYYGETVSLLPGDLFDSSFDGSATATGDPTLINGNEHSVRGNSSGIVEVSAADGAVGNTVNLTFDADHGGADGGWISAVDNVLVRALAAGDAQADGDVDPADLIQLLAGGAFGQGNIDATWGQGDFDNDGDFDGTDILAVVQGLAGEFPKTYAHDPSNGVPDVLINPATGNITLDTNGTTIGSIVMDSAAGIFNGPNSPSWDAPGDFAADIDTQISMPISFTNPGYTGVDDLGDGIIGDLAPGFDILADLTIKYLDPNGDLLDAEAHVVPEPSSMVLATFGVLGMLGYLWRRRRLS